MLANFLWLIYFSRFLDIKSVDSYLSILAISAPIFVFFNLDLRRLITLDICFKKSNYEYLVLRAFVNSFAFLLSLLFISIFFDFELFLILIVCGSKLFEAISELYFGVYARENVQKFQLYNRISKLALTTVSIFILYFFTLDMYISFLLYLLCFIVPTVSIDIRKGRQTVRDFSINMSNIKDLAKTGSSLGIEGVLIALASSLPVILISSYSASGQVAIYGTVTYIVTALHLAYSSIYYGLAGDLKSKFSHNPRHFTRTYINYVSLIILILISLTYMLSDVFANLLIYIFNWDFSEVVISDIGFVRLSSLYFILGAMILSTILLFFGDSVAQKYIRLFKLSMIMLPSLILIFLDQDVDAITMSLIVLISSLIEFITFAFILNNKNRLC